MVQALKQLVRDHDALRITDQQFVLRFIGILCAQSRVPQDFIYILKSAIRSFQVGGEG